MTTASVPPELLDAVVEYFRPLRVILFGSAARGDAGPDSDIDLLVILDDSAPPQRLTLAAGYQSRRSYHRAVDVIRAAPPSSGARAGSPEPWPTWRQEKARSSMNGDEESERRREAAGWLVVARDAAGARRVRELRCTCALRV